MEGSCSTGQSPQRAVVPVEEEEEEEEEMKIGPRLPVFDPDHSNCYPKIS
jgi:hypothetical protein